MPNMRDWTPEQWAAARAKAAETRRRNAGGGSKSSKKRPRRSAPPISEYDEQPEELELDDGPEFEAEGGAKEPKLKRPPKIAKSALLTSMTEHAATIGARGLQAATWRSLGRRNALTVKEAQGLVQPAGRLVARRVAMRIQLPGMSTPDADDAGEMLLTLAEYILRLAAQAVDDWIQRLMGESEEHREQRQRTPPTPRYAPAADEDPTAPVWDERPEAPVTAAAIVPNAPAGANGLPLSSQVRAYAMSQGLQPYTGEP